MFISILSAYHCKTIVTSVFPAAQEKAETGYSLSRAYAKISWDTEGEILYWRNAM
jgi:hypothetical protein